MSENYKLKFIPHLKKGLSANAQYMQNKGRFQKNVTVLLKAAGNETAVNHSILLRGPQDVIGVHQSAFARVFPAPGTNDFENNLFPFVEFKEPDFPWRFSLQKDRDDRLIPWISLIILEKKQYTLEKLNIHEGQEVVKITIDKENISLLPDLSSAWAWAHVQLSSDVTEDQINAAFTEDSELNCSRLLCPRKLAPHTSYSAFLVPVYEIGRLAGLGMTFGNNETDDSSQPLDQNLLCPWSITNKNSISLPVYYQWDFQTGEGGDFETLVKKIEPLECPEGVGQRQIDGSQMPEVALDDENRLNFALEGVLLPFTYDREVTDVSDCMNIIHKKIKEAIKIDENDDEDPIVTIPVYGKHYKKLNQLLEKDLPHYSSKNWAQEINIKRGYRTIAGMGTDVVVKNQDQYMTICREQVGAINEANEEIRRAQLGKILNQGIKNKHMDKLTDREFTAVTSSFYHYYGYKDSHFKKYLEETGLPAGLTSSAGRKVFSQKLKNNKDAAGSNIFDKFIDLPQQAGNNPLYNTPLKTEAVTIDIKENVFTNHYRKKFQPEKDNIRRLNKMLAIGEKEFLKKLAPIMAAPKIPIPMYQYLADLNVEYMIPNLKLIENNKVTLLIENRKFLESYMLGLNHEMNRELVWREFPTDRKGTIFKYFWSSLNPEYKECDISDIVMQWEMEKFGNNRPTPTNNISMILGIKADLIRRYPDAQFHVIVDDKGNMKKKTYWESYLANFEDKLEDPRYDKKIFAPEFFAMIGNDTLFLGFPQEELTLEKEMSLRMEKVKNLYFVISEIPFLPRFGLDPGAPGDTIYNLSWENMAVDQNSHYINALSENAALPEVNNQPFWDKDSCNSALIARYTMQLPVRIVIPAKLLIPAE